MLEAFITSCDSNSSTTDGRQLCDRRGTSRALVVGAPGSRPAVAFESVDGLCSRPLKNGRRRSREARRDSGIGDDWDFRTGCPRSGARSERGDHRLAAYPRPQPTRARTARVRVTDDAVTAGIDPCGGGVRRLLALQVRDALRHHSRTSPRSSSELALLTRPARFEARASHADLGDLAVADRRWSEGAAPAAAAPDPRSVARFSTLTTRSGVISGRRLRAGLRSRRADSARPARDARDPSIGRRPRRGGPIRGRRAGDISTDSSGSGVPRPRFPLAAARGDSPIPRSGTPSTRSAPGRRSGA